MYRLIYKSRSVGKIDWNTIEHILHASEKQNTAHDISGILLATDSHFLQILEGRYEDVNDTFIRIVRDPRHDQIRMVSFDVIDAKLFSGWGMRGIGAFDFNNDLEAMLKEKYGEEDDGVKFPLEEWMVLAMVQDIKMVHDLPSWKA